MQKGICRRQKEPMLMSWPPSGTMLCICTEHRCHRSGCLAELDMDVSAADCQCIAQHADYLAAWDKQVTGNELRMALAFEQCCSEAASLPVADCIHCVLLPCMSQSWCSLGQSILKMTAT